MNRCAQEFLGTHDFIGFCSSGGKMHDTIRTIYDCGVTRSGDLVEFRVTGSGFLYNMVRIMVGTLRPAGPSRFQEGDIARIVASRDRKRAGITVGPSGLYLNRVIYGIEEYRKKKKREKRIRNLIRVAAVLLIIGALLGGAYLYNRYDVEQLLQNAVENPGVMTPAAVQTTSFPVSLDSVEPLDIQPFGDSVALLTSDEAALLDSNGKTSFQFDH